MGHSGNALTKRRLPWAGGRPTPTIAFVLVLLGVARCPDSARAAGPPAAVPDQTSEPNETPIDVGPPLAAPVAEAEIAPLIDQLGEKSFIAREKATRQLLEIGSEAVPFLERAKASTDREIRSRARHLLEEIGLQDRQRRIAQFLAEGPDQSAVSLPGWESLRDQLGDTPASRRLLAEMLEQEWDLLTALSYDKMRLTSTFNTRVAEVLSQLRQQQMTVSEPSLCALLLAGIDEQARVTQESHSYVSSLCYRLKIAETDTLPTADATQTREGVIRGLIAHWIRKEVGEPGLYQNLNLSLRFGLPEGLGLAQRIVENPMAPADKKVLAILAVARFGDPSHAKLLEPLLADKTVAYQEKDPRSQEARFQMQLRDVALASLWKLAGQDPKNFGFERLRPTPMTIYITNSIGFDSEEKREQAFAAWRDRAK